MSQKLQILLVNTQNKYSSSKIDITIISNNALYCNFVARFYYRIPLKLEAACEPVSFFFFTGSGAKHFHSRKVSSAPADNTVLPSGDMARCNTRAECPVNSAT
jgi:hypothetical protein